MTAALWTLNRGSSSLLINVPHAGVYIPGDIRASLSLVAQAAEDTDWHVPLLYEFALHRDATLMAATHSRYVVDLNRDPGHAELYPGADNTELVPTRSFHNQSLYRESPPTPDAVRRRHEQYWEPYHAELARQLERVRARHGYVLLLDAHSIDSVLPRFFDGQLPHLNLGTADGSSCSAELQALATTVVGGDPTFTSVVNGRFKGGYITRHYGRPQQGLHALQLEISQRAYMDEGPPFAWNPGRASALIRTLQRLVDVLLAWRPAPT